MPNLPDSPVYRPDDGRPGAAGPGNESRRF